MNKEIARKVYKSKWFLFILQRDLNKAPHPKLRISFLRGSLRISLKERFDSGLNLMKQTCFVITMEKTES